jgi:hypothetical protein
VPAPSTTRVTSVSWDPSPIAPAGSLGAGHKVTVTLAALDSVGVPVAGGQVIVAFDQAPQSNATATATGCNPTSGPGTLCTADATGHITFTYTRGSGPNPLTTGSDALQASSAEIAHPPITTDTYSYP